MKRFVAGLLLLATLVILVIFVPRLGSNTAVQVASAPQIQNPPVTPFENIAPDALQDGYEVWNDRPGVAVFDYDRDGDLDFYITSEGGKSNWLYRNNGDGTFSNIAEEAGVSAVRSYSTGVVACDIDNDGFQDLYVGAWGITGDELGFRSSIRGQPNKDLLFLNNRDGTFRDITDSAFGDGVNLRSATSVACADVDGDGWLDIYVGNLLDNDFRFASGASHAGHYNLLYRNNGDITFTEVAHEAGVEGPQIIMRDLNGQPIVFDDPDTGEMYEGYDPTITDRLGNRVGEPTGQTHAVLFFDYDDDGDSDLWVANDGDRLHLYRNDSTPGNIRFTQMERTMGIDRAGSWMGFAVGDYDSDADLDVFVTNIGFHPLLQPIVESPRGTCEYHGRFSWGTCSHYMLRNDGGGFTDVASSVKIKPSALMPPDSLDPSKIHPDHRVPTGLAAYDFGFGATFFDYDNDGDQDFYWLGSTVARGEAPGGRIFPGAGRMMRGDGQGNFEDITVRVRLLDILDVDYFGIESIGDDSEELDARRINPNYHENGKGLAHGDLNGDGYVDLIGTNSSGEQFTKPLIITVPTQPAPGPVFVWMNGSGENHWITLRLKGRMAVDGTGSNADGIGARVYVRTGEHTQVQEVRAGSSYLSMDSIDLEFGLGPATVVDEIRILWPSGITQTLRDVAVDRVVSIAEPTG